MQEAWLPIKHYEDFYEISNFGNVKSLRTMSLMKLQKAGQGYSIIGLNKPGAKPIKSYVHRLVAQHFIGESELCVSHIDRDKTNNCVSNLQLISYSESLKRSAASGKRKCWGQPTKPFTATEKVCTGCKILKPLSDYYNCSIKRNKSGRTSKCIVCIKRAQDTDERRSRDRAYHYNNKEIRNIKSKEYHVKNQEILNLKSHQYAKNNRKKISSQERDRKKTDINFRLTKQLRTRINQVLRDGSKTGSAVSDLGCSVEEFRIYIESKFKQGMTWDNWALNGWHLDHIRPLASFDLTDREQFLKAANYNNIQPLWAYEHKHKTITDKQFIKETKNERAP